MATNKKGLSTIVATLLIILLTLVAVGIIWVVVRNVVKGGTEQVDIDAKCLHAGVVANAVNLVTLYEDENRTYTVTLTREGTGSDELGGVRIVFKNALATQSQVFDVPGNIRALETITTNLDDANVTITDPASVTVYSYFLDASGNPKICSTSNTKTF